jgi:hypothetical protein
MTMKRLFTTASILVLILTASSLILAQTDPFNGAWKLNVEKSKFDPGPAYKSETRAVQPSGEITVERVNADGTTQSYRYNAKYDGKDYPITGQGPNGADALAMKKMDANTVQASVKKSGKVLFTNRAVVSKDGRVMTFTTKGKNANGQPFTNVLVYDKQ